MRPWWHLRSEFVNKVAALAAFLAFAITALAVIPIWVQNYTLFIVLGIGFLFGIVTLKEEINELEAFDRFIAARRREAKRMKRGRLTAKKFRDWQVKVKNGLNITLEDYKKVEKFVRDTQPSTESEEAYKKSLDVYIEIFDMFLWEQPRLRFYSVSALLKAKEDEPQYWWILIFRKRDNS
jgi:hypothetical protein